MYLDRVIMIKSIRMIFNWYTIRHVLCPCSTM